MDTSLSDSQALPAGTRLEEFMIESVLGSGGFGITYLARDTSLNRQVVIKENLPSQFVWRETATGTVRPRHSTGGDADDFEWSMRNFLREAETLASMDHPGIVKVLRKFETNGTAYFVMPFVQGVDFGSLIEDRQRKGKPFTEEELRGLTERVLDALGYLHDRGIYHRDIKPGNILVTNEGVPVLIDFGSARQQLSERSMTVVESAGYTPFEQLQSRGNVGPWSDLYAFGGTLYKALTGATPPKANDRAFDDPLSPLESRVDLLNRYTPELLSTIDRALAVKVADRWQDAGEWHMVLRRHADRTLATRGEAPDSKSGGPVEFRSPAATNSSKVARIKKLIWSAGVLVLLGLLCFGGWGGWKWDQTRRREIARREAEVDDKKQVVKRQAIRKAMDALGMFGNPDNLDPLEREAVELYRAASGGNEPAAMTRLATCFHEGKGTPKDPMMAERWIRKAAEAGDANGMNRLGLCYVSGKGVVKDPAEAVKWYRRAAEAGDAHAMINLGVTLLSAGEAGSGYEKVAVSWFSRAAKAGDPIGMIWLGHCHLRGTGFTRDPVEAVKCYRQAAEMQVVLAMVLLGRCYLEGEGVSKDKAIGVSWFLKAAEADDRLGRVSLGLCHDTGTGVSESRGKAQEYYDMKSSSKPTSDSVYLAVALSAGREFEKWLRDGAETAGGPAMNVLGRCYDDGTGVAKDETEAVKWYRKAADAGYGFGMKNLGVCYDNGTGVAKDEAEAVKWYRKAAEAGNSCGMFNLAYCYYYGTGVSKDEAEAVKWSRKAADAGDANGMVALGFSYKEGSGVSKDEAEAVKWYRKAADAGDANGMVNLGVCYDNGTGVAKDEAEAVKWYRKAADAGDANGMVTLGFSYKEGSGVSKDEAEAVKWYRKAADAGDANGMVILGVCYKEGTGVSKDEVEVVKWYRKAADAGDADGMNNLGVCYKEGTGVSKDEVEAVKWYRKAADAGSGWAMKNLGSCYKHGTGVAKDLDEAVKWFRKASGSDDKEAAKLAREELERLGR